MSSSIGLYGDFNEEEDARMGDEEDENVNFNQGDGSDENAATNKIDVDAGIKVKKVRRKLVTLNETRLKGDRGIIAIEDFFKTFKPKGKGHEKHDLNDIMKRLEYWSHRMFPKYHFDDSLGRIDQLSKKKEIIVHMSRYRLGQLEMSKDEDNQICSDSEKNEAEVDNSLNEPAVDDFENLLNQQIARTTQFNASFSSTASNNNISSFSSLSAIAPNSQAHASQNKNSNLTDQQRTKIEENRRRALELRAVKLKEAEEKHKKPAVIVTEISDDEFEEIVRYQTGNAQQNEALYASQDTSFGNMSKVSTSTQAPHHANQSSVLTNEQRERMEENRQKALRIRAAKLKEAEDKRKRFDLSKIPINIDDDFF